MNVSGLLWDADLWTPKKKSPVIGEIVEEAQ